MIPSDSLMTKLYARSNVAELFGEFNEIYNCLCGDEQTEYFQFFLRAAVEQRHVELVKLVLTSISNNHKNYLRCIRTPFYISISKGDVEIVNIFLQSNVSLKLLKVFSSPTQGGKEELFVDEDKLSPIQRACFCDQRDVLKLLLAYHRDQTRGPCIEYSGFTGYYKSERHTDCVHDTPLHNVMPLLHIDHFRGLSSLPTIVQLIIESGVDVNVLYHQQCTALALLIHEVGRLRTMDKDITDEESDMIVEAANILLMASSVTTDIESPNPFDMLIDLALSILQDIGSLALLIIHRNYYETVFKLIKNFAKNGTVFVRYRLHSKSLFDNILYGTACCTSQYTRTTDTVHRKELQSIIGNMADMFGYFLLSEADAMNSSLFLDSPVSLLGIMIDEILFVAIIFAAFLGYSSQLGKPSKFVRLLLNYLNASHLNRLKIRMSEPTESDVQLTSNIRGYEEYRKTALQVLGKVDIPFSLQQLSRRAIIRAMSYRCLGAVDWSTLCLPRNVLDDLLTCIQ